MNKQLFISLRMVVLSIICASVVGAHLIASTFALSPSYTIDNQWPQGYQITVTIKNSTAQATTSWNASFTIPTGHKITSSWNGVFTTQGANITVANPVWTGGGVIPANSSTTFGMVISRPANSAIALTNLQATANGTTPVNPVPAAPVLNAISISSTNPANYTISWNASTNATSYTLQQSSTSNFANPVTITNTSSLSYAITNQANGTYYYRVDASNSSGASAYSNTESVTITQSAPPVPSTLPKPLIDAYWESWNSNDPISAIVAMHVDVINIAFANFTTTGTHTYEIAGINADEATVQQFITAAHAAGKLVKICVGGATYPLSPQLKTTQDAVGMAQAVATFVAANNLDGVDYDIEDYPAAALQIALLQNSRALMPNKLVTYTPKSPASSTAPYEQVIQGGYQYLDYISIMAYDYAPGYTYQADVQALIGMGVPAGKIVVGLMPGMDDVGVETSVANIQTAAHYIVQNNLAGIMFWDLDRDYENQTGLGKDAATNAAYAIFHP